MDTIMSSQQMTIDDLLLQIAKVNAVKTSKRIIMDKVYDHIKAIADKKASPDTLKELTDTVESELFKTMKGEVTVEDEHNGW